MSLAHQCLLGYFPLGPWEMLIVLAIAILLLRGWRNLSEWFEEVLRRDRRLRVQWFLHAKEAEQQASRTASQALVVLGVMLLSQLAVIIILPMLH